MKTVQTDFTMQTNQNPTDRGFKCPDFRQTRDIFQQY